MKESLFLVLISIMFGTTGCLLHDGLTHNLNQNLTSVVLQDDCIKSLYKTSQ